MIIGGYFKRDDLVTKRWRRLQAKSHLDSTIYPQTTNFPPQTTNFPPKRPTFPPNDQLSPHCSCLMSDVVI